MSGINRHTGRKINGDASLIQSVQDILTTPKGTRLMRRKYGSDLPDIIDQPLNGETMVDAYMAVIDAIDRWEPRLNVVRVQAVEIRAGYAEFEISDDDGKITSIVTDLAAEAGK